MELFLSTISHIFLLLGHMQIFFLIMSRFWISVGGSLAFFLHMSCFRISVGGFLAFFGICPTLGFLWEVSSPFFAYVPPFNTATKSLSDDTYLFINIPCI